MNGFVAHFAEGDVLCMFECTRITQLLAYARKQYNSERSLGRSDFHEPNPHKRWRRKSDVSAASAAAGGRGCSLRWF